MSQVRYVMIDENQVGRRIDNYLFSCWKNVPRGLVYRVLRKGQVRVNKKRVKAEYRLQEGDEVRLPPVNVSTAETVNIDSGHIGFLSKRIIFEDQGLIVINKPSGMPVHGGTGVSYGVIEAMRVLRPELRYLELVHRLDKETSGCLMLAKKPSQLRLLHAAFQAGEGIEKYYHAWVDGAWNKQCHVVDMPLRKMTRASGERVVRIDTSEQGKAAKTLFRVLQKEEGATLIEVRPLTGRTHQIRVHCQYAGHAILGDKKYGEAQGSVARRLMLHAHRLKLTVGEKESEFVAPYDHTWRIPV